jgi:hypothetical protein
MYEYKNLRKEVFTESGVKMLLEMRDKARLLSRSAGAVRMDKIMGGGDSWHQLACADYLVEIGDLRRISSGTAGQYQVFQWTGGD